MPLPRLLLPLCVLLLTLAVTAASAVAPVYGAGEVAISVGATPDSTTQFEQLSRCSSMGGVLAPMVTDVVYMLVLSAMNNAGVKSSFGYMGGSTMLSSSECTTSEASLSCIWYWDQGRYAGAANALAFYRGNRDPRILSGAGMVSTTVGNYWRVYSSSERFPCGYMQRYGAVLHDESGAPNWADTSATEWSYGSVPSENYYTVCATEQITLNPASTTTTSQPPEAKKSSDVSLPMVIGMSVGAAVVVGVIVVLILSLPCCFGWCCFARSRAEAGESSFPQPEDEYRCEPRRTGSQHGDMSRANSFRSRHSGYGDVDNRSFHDGAAGKDGYSRRSSFHGSVGAAEAGVWQNDCEMTSVAASQYPNTNCDAYGSWAPPPRAASQMMMQPQPPTSMYGNWQTWEEPMPVGVYATEPSGAEMQRRSSNVNPEVCDMSDSDDADAANGASV